ncbi:MAG: S8 family serine peptidase [Chloroflexi bacterium]|nr:S8 family serine peptidase [Chloroflexota bacterium]
MKNKNIRMEVTSKALLLIILLVFIAAVFSGCGGGASGGGAAGETALMTPPAPPSVADSASSGRVVDQGGSKKLRSASIPEGAEYVPGEVIIKVKGSTASEAETKSTLLRVSKNTGISLQTVRAFNEIRARMMKIESGEPVPLAVKRLSTDPNIEYAEPNYIYKADMIPNDTYFGYLWGLYNTGQDVQGTAGTAGADIDAVDAWDIQLGSLSVAVAIIDTGVDYNHEDLAANMWHNPGEIPGNGIDDDGNGYIDDVYGINAITGTGNPMDDNGHGTHVAGTIAAVGNNGRGVIGVAPGVRIMALKFLSSGGSGANSDAITCIDYAISKGVRIASNSWGGGGFSSSLSDAITRARDNNMLFVCAAGNDGANNDTYPHYPSSYDQDNIISVAASNNIDSLADFSNYGAESVDLAAPGVSIYSSIPNNGYDYKSGTSMATPHIAGIAALCLSNLNQSYSQLKSRILFSVEPGPEFAGKMSSSGRANVYNSLTYVPSSDPRILSIYPSQELARGDSITVNGVNFQTAQGAGYVVFSGTSGDVNAANYTSWSDSRVVCTVPAGIVGAAVVAVHSNSGTASNTFPVSIVASAIRYSVTPAVYNWITPASGDIISLTGDDNAVNEPIGFNFTFYGNVYSSINITTNGYLWFGTASSSSYWDNVSIPSSSAPNNIICPWWDDLNVTDGTGNVYATLTGVSPNRKLVITWENIGHYTLGNSAVVTFQAILEETTGNIKFQYNDTDFGDSNYNKGVSATIGVENSTGFRGTQFSYDTSSVQNGTAILFTVEDSQTGAVTGTVTRSDNGQPVSGATVAVGDRNSTTGASGQYTITNVSAGVNQVITAYLDGFLNYSGTVDITGGSTTIYNFQMTPGLVATGSVTGVVKVYNSDGAPIEGAVVRIGGVSNTTGADGSYTLDGVQVGTQTIQAGGAGYYSFTGTVTVIENNTVTRDIYLFPDTGPSLPARGGWNFISFPKISVTSLTNLGAYPYLYKFLPGNGYSRVVPPGDLPLDTTYGYWFRSDINRNIPYIGTDNDGSLNEVQLSRGWNALGVPFTSPASFGSTGLKYGGTTYSLSSKVGLIDNGVNLAYAYVFYYDALNGRYIAVDTRDTEKTLDPGKGYWIYCYRDLNYIFDVSVPAPNPPGPPASRG